MATTWDLYSHTPESKKNSFKPLKAFISWHLSVFTSDMMSWCQMAGCTRTCGYSSRKQKKKKSKVASQTAGRTKKTNKKQRQQLACSAGNFVAWGKKKSSSQANFCSFYQSLTEPFARPKKLPVKNTKQQQQQQQQLYLRKTNNIYLKIFVTRKLAKRAIGGGGK